MTEGKKRKKETMHRGIEKWRGIKREDAEERDGKMGERERPIDRQRAIIFKTNDSK